MDRTRLLVVALVVLGGCGSFGGNPDPGPDLDRTLTPAPIPESTLTPRDPLPPSVTGNGVADVDALVTAHTAALENRSFTLRVRISRDDETNLRLVRVEGHRRYYYRDETQAVEGTRTEFVLDRFRYTRTVEPPAGLQFGRYRGSDYADRYGQIPGETLRSYLSAGNVTVLRTTVNGERRYELRADRSPRREPDLRTNYSVRATVRPDGFVSSLEASYVRPHDGGRTNVTVTVEHTDLDSTTVDPPAWVVRRWTVAANASTPRTSTPRVQSSPA